MKKYYVVTVALILALFLVLPLALPAASASDNKVIGRVTGMAQGGYGVKPMSSLGGNVKLLSDGTIKGNWHVHFYKSYPWDDPSDYLADTEWKCTEFISLIFTSANRAEIKGLFSCVNAKHKGETYIMEFWITDNGEPGIGQDTWWGPGVPETEPLPVEHGNFQVVYEP